MNEKPKEKKKFPVVKFIFVTLLVGMLLLVFFRLGFYVLSLYPFNTLWSPKYRYENDYYTVEVSSYVSGLWLHGGVDPHLVEPPDRHNMVAYYAILQLEENYLGDWELENPVKQEEVDGYEHWKLYTESTLPTQKITKYWWFYPDRPYFKVKIIKEYTVTGDNCNNQIIFDGLNTGIHTGPDWFAYESEWGTYGCIILDSDPEIIIQVPGSICPHGPTEYQLNFHNQSDRDLLHHERGEVEWVELLVYADSYGVWSDVKELGGE